jgi:glyoxylase-like metal-dependent hydrolase (beta-lactamase superfamily II)
MKVHVEPRPLTEPLPGGGGEGTTVVVEPLKIGEVIFPAESFESTGGRFANLRALGIGVPRSRWPTVPCPAFLIRHPSAGPFVVDTGLHPSVTAKPAANFGRLAASVVKPKLEPGEDLPAQLRARGLDAKALRLVVMTHLHYDHASGMSEFPSANFVLTEAEWRFATTVSRPILHGYRPAHYDYAFEYRTLSYNRRGIDSYSTFGRTFDLFGDGSVRLVSLPGHTPGHQGVLCRLHDRDLLIAGDAIYTHGQVTDRPPAPRPEDPHTYRRSLQELRLFHRQFPQAVIIPGHDPEFWRTLAERYE